MTTPVSSLDLWLFAEYVSEQFQHLNQQIGKIVTDVVVQQEALDALAASLEAVKASLAAEISSLQTQLPAGSLQGLQTALDDLQTLEPPASSPAPPTPPVDAPPTT
jgi:hypothetical protein